MTARSLEQLGSTIVQNVATLSRSLQDQGTRSPTVQDINAPELKNVNEAATVELVNAARELQALAQGPGQQLSLLAFAVCIPSMDSQYGKRRTLVICHC